MTSPISNYSTVVSPTGSNVSRDNTLTEGTDQTKLNSKAFLQLLVAQLQYQDPSKPVDTSSFMNETATLTQVQTSEANAQNSIDMLAAQRAQTASSLVGKTITYTGTDGKATTGVVSAATISSPVPTLKVGSTEITLSQVQQVLQSATA